MPRALKFFVLFALGIAASATTLERLNLDQMIERSSLIVRGQVLDSSAVKRGSTIYTVYRVKVTQWIKGSGSSQVLEVNLPGGKLGGYRQSFAGTPTLQPGAENVLFLWTSPRGFQHVLGLSQGVFDITTNSRGETVLSRGPVEDAEMLNSEGQAVADAGMKMSMSALKSKVAAQGGLK